MAEPARPEGIPGSVLAGPYPVGAYAARLRDQLRGFKRVQLFGEVVGFKAGGAKVYWELRDGAGALPCSMWRQDWEGLRLGPRLEDGAQVVLAGGCDYYPGSRTSSPSFSFDVVDVRLAGEGDLLAQLAVLRRRLDAEGLFTRQAALARPVLPRCIGVVTGQSGKARDDVVAGLLRRGWRGRLVWAFAPVQDRHAAPAITRALQDLAACPEVDVIVVARGGGSLMDLFAFCDETLCRTVSMLRVPVVASVGHHTDRTLIDDVAAVSCSTPTHAAEAAVPLHCAVERERLLEVARRFDVAGRRALSGRERLALLATRIDVAGRRAVVVRARALAAVSRAPAAHVERHRLRLHQHLREVRASSLRSVAARSSSLARWAGVVDHRRTAASSAVLRDRSRARGEASVVERRAAAAVADRRAALDRLALALAAHDPQRTLERGYALLESPDGTPVDSAATARSLDRMTVRLHDGTVDVRRDG